MNPFTALGISKHCTEDDVKKIYRQLALNYHPDKAGKGATARFQEVNAGYETVIEEKLYSRPGDSAETTTDRCAGSTSSNGAGSDCRRKSQQSSHQRPTQVSARPRPPPQTPRSPPRPAAQPPPSPKPPRPQPPRPLSPTRNDPDLGDFVRIYDTLYTFVVSKILYVSGYPPGWPETRECFEELKNMLRKRASSFRLSSQLGILVYTVKMLWADSYDAVSAKFVRGYSFGAMMSILQRIEPVSTTGRLLRIAENVFIEQQGAYNRSLLDCIKLEMSDNDKILRRLYRRILSSISEFLDWDRRDHPDMRYSSRGKTMAYKLAIRLKYANISNEAGVCSEWLAVGVGRIMLSLRILQANRFFWTESGEKLWVRGSDSSVGSTQLVCLASLVLRCLSR